MLPLYSKCKIQRYHCISNTKYICAFNYLFHIHVFQILCDCRVTAVKVDEVTVAVSGSTHVTLLVAFALMLQ